MSNGVLDFLETNVFEPIQGFGEKIGDARFKEGTLNRDDFIAEEAAVGGTTYSKYITREVTFNNPSTGIRVIFDASVPLNSNLDLYFKTKLAGDSTKFSDIEYQKVSDFTIPNSLDGSFVEFEKQINNINAFNSITFKIVFNANNTQNVPRIKNFRLIAVS